MSFKFSLQEVKQSSKIVSSQARFYMRVGLINEPYETVPFHFKSAIPML